MYVSVKADSCVYRHGSYGVGKVMASRKKTRRMEEGWLGTDVVRP
jgi:hypothetical protein